MKTILNEVMGRVVVVLMLTAAAVVAIFGPKLALRCMRKALNEIDADWLQPDYLDKKYREAPLDVR